MKAFNQFREIEVNVANEPALTFDTVALASKDHSTIHMAGPHRWNRLQSTTDLSPFFGEEFSLIDSKWSITGCFVCDDKTSIYFKHATLVGV